MTSTFSGLKNSFIDLYHWVQGELYDLEAIYNAVNGRNEIDKKLTETMKKKSSTQKDIDDINAGNKSVSTAFKSKDDIPALERDLQRYVSDIEATEQLLSVVTAYLGANVLPNLKQEKLKQYRRVQQAFHVAEISNNHQVASFWSNVLKQEAVRASAQ
jgi:hypothetical protein